MSELITAILILAFLIIGFIWIAVSEGNKWK